MFPKVTINGNDLNMAQVLTLHCAIQNYIDYLLDEIDNGEIDEDGSDKALRNAYLSRIKEVSSLMLTVDGEPATLLTENGNGD